VATPARRGSHSRVERKGLRQPVCWARASGVHLGLRQAEAGWRPQRAGAGARRAALPEGAG
jgi:hypothetical protein